MSPGHTCAVSFSFDLDADEVWLGENPEAARRPVTLSQGRYGPRVGLPAILALLGRHEVRTTFFVPGRVAERYPAAVESVLAAGHELAHHGYTHRAPALLTYDEEVEEFERSIAALRTFGVDPFGYRAPSWNLTDHTLGLVERFGFRYSSNFMTDIVPFRHEDADVIEVPVHWLLDDAAHFWFNGDTWTKKISTNSEVEEIFWDETDGIARMGGCAVYTLHPQIMGRPSRIALLEKLVARVIADDRLDIATTGDIARRALKELP